jgi:inhibitor of KinA sporulation pathway (predicted exonuclease)
MTIAYICVLDFEATCWDDKSVSRRLMEIIEFPSVLIKWDTESGETKRISEIQNYCKPTIKPTLSAFCTELTGITQETVDGSIPFPEALKRHTTWLIEHVPDFYNNNNVHIVTCGNWDLQTQLPRDLKYWKTENITNVYKRFINIKYEFNRFVKPPDKIGGMFSMLKYLDLSLDGRHHSGIDDCRNIAKIWEEMIQRGMKYSDNQVIDVQSKLYRKQKQCK